jgi:class 3 adenylate cyclase
MIDTIARGHDAAQRHDWSAAVESLAAADEQGQLAPADLELLGAALWWAGRPDEASEALQRAFSGYVSAGRKDMAARAALRLAYDAFRGLAGPVGGGWLARAEDLLEGQPESGIHAWPPVFHAVEALMTAHFGDGIDHAQRAMDVARRHDNLDALYVAMSFKGMAQVFIGQTADGLALIDEAAAAASSGQLDLRMASDIYCNTISACRSIGDLARAGQWADEGERFMRRQKIAGYPGICRIHRAEIKMLRGQWPEAEQEARQASEELLRFRLLDGVGFAYYEVGEVRLRMGDLEAAAEAFDRAYEYGHTAQPGLAMLQLARGEVADARRSIDRALATAAGAAGIADRTTRARLLPAKVDIALADHDLDGARAAVEELETIATDFAQPLFQAGALTARGELLLGEDRAPEASPVLGESWRLWQTSDLPYESARARLHYAEALSAEGDAAMARRDLVAARSTFERLGATRDLERIDALLGDDAEPAAATTRREGSRVERGFMFTDIVTSTDLVSLIGDAAWRDLLDWHDRELRATFARHGGQEVTHTGDGFFVAFDEVGSGIDCAVDIQRRLARHRREHGFAPRVRIGLHVAEATRRGVNYSGGGVHVAARVGAAAEGEEILITRAASDAAQGSRYPLSDPRSIKLKGVPAPVEVMAVDWR